MRLSYHHLPSQLKPMFGYCAIFPKDYEFDKDELVLLWMAEGFLQQSQRMRKCMKELGDDCFNELLSRSFFQPSSGMKSKFTMHDLLNDLAQHVTGEICFRMEDNMDNNERCNISPKACHSAFMRHYCEVYKRFKAFDHELHRLRTFLALPISKSDTRQTFCLSNGVLVNIPPKLLYLRVLLLTEYDISELPNSIGDLKHLRLLNLSGTSIKWLPKSVTDLYNLQTLSLHRCSELCKLPTNIGNLVNLRHLGIKLQEMPRGISKLISLQTLPKASSERTQHATAALSLAPLAVKTLGGVLRNRRSPREWKDVLDSEIWDLPEDKSSILPTLRLSYHHLPSQLKQMFAYCAIFPKDYEFDKEELVLLWMAEGFLQQSQGVRKLIQELGDDCFNELLSRSFFQPSSSTKSKFTMHDLLNDLAQHVAGEICFRMEDNTECIERCRISPKARHSAFMRHECEMYKRFKAFDHELLSLRTFLALPVYRLRWCCFLSDSILVNILPKLLCLRVLSMSGYNIRELPNSIGDLKHLRYLNLSGTSIKWLPESVNGLYNLQTLLLRGCRELCKLPADIGNLVNLCHLDNANTQKLQEMPPEISKLKSLQTLPKFVVCKSGGLGLNHLNNLALLRGMLSIVGLQNVKDVRDAEDANINRKRDLDELELLWSSEDEDSQNEELQANVLNMLRPHKGLKRLKIEFYRGLTFPSWIGDLSFSKTTQISLKGCTKCASLPPLGQLPLLKELHIQGMHAVKNVGAEFYGDGGSLETRFPSLETLSFEDMPEWEGWCSCIGVEFVGHFPCLRQLTMSKCPKLVSVSVLRLPSLCKLKIERCREVVLKSLIELTSLRQLFIKDISGLTHLQEEFTHFLVSLENFEVCDCAALVTLWQKGNTPKHLSHLQHLSVVGCSKLVCLTEEDQMLPRNLESLRVSGCDCLGRLPNGLESHTSLKVLELEKCPKLVSFQEANLPPMLRSLRLTDCSSLESLPNCNSCLEELCLNECSSLRCLPMDTFSSTLKSLEIRNCEELGSILEPIRLNIIMEEPGCFRISDWPNLEKLSVSMPPFYCDLSYKKGQPFPTGSSLITPNLRRLRISGIANDIYFASKFQSLTSLTVLFMSYCDNLESFPQENLPPNLKDIFILNCNNLKPLSEWGLHSLFSSNFHMNGVCIPRATFLAG
ncbi:unnamed protein product [Ilex paraguariensis]|uniref:Disease resistance RPP13-like protein 1 n=1 Tax=Ilex paraguariensis TaxID=185542 RepID=A0ABC8UR87_9AQUA